MLCLGLGKGFVGAFVIELTYTEPGGFYPRVGILQPALEQVLLQHQEIEGIRREFLLTVIVPIDDRLRQIGHQPGASPDGIDIDEQSVSPLEKLLFIDPAEKKLGALFLAREIQQPVFHLRGDSDGRRLSVHHADQNRDRVLHEIRHVRPGEVGTVGVLAFVVAVAVHAVRDHPGSRREVRRALLFDYPLTGVQIGHHLPIRLAEHVVGMSVVDTHQQSPVVRPTRMRDGGGVKVSTSASAWSGDSIPREASDCFDSIWIFPLSRLLYPTRGSWLFKRT